jgi:polysaccharide export outer membrane protein
LKRQFAALLLTFIVSLGASAQQTSTSATIAAPTNSLIIGPGDTLVVHVLDTPELDQTARVEDSGRIPLLLIGETNVKGLTPGEAASAIASNLRRGNFMLDPHVTVTVQKYATAGVTVLGQVRLPGSYTIDTPRTVLDILAMAGGLTDEAERKITVEHARTKERVDYFVDNNAHKALDTNFLVYPGDRIIVEKAPTVYMLGDVNKPGGYEHTTNDGKVTVLQAVALAGGIQHTGSGNKAHLLRKMPDGTVSDQKINIAAMESGKVKDFNLLPDDILYIPYSYIRQIGVSGAENLFAVAATAAVYRF